MLEKKGNNSFWSKCTVWKITKLHQWKRTESEIREKEEEGGKKKVNRKNERYGKIAYGRGIYKNIMKGTKNAITHCTQIKGKKSKRI